MSTAVLLHGGRLRTVDSRNDEYFKCLTRDVKDGEQVLFVGFAQHDSASRSKYYEKEENSRQKYYERDKGYILAQTHRDITVINATPEDFERQLSESKAVHITGGNTSLLVETIKQYPNFLELIDGKCVGGSSAGAMLFSTIYWNGEQNTVMKGLGTLPVAVLCHFNSEEFNSTQDQLDILKQAAGDLEVIALEECEWVEKET
jgi:peptidase E